jgi:hypothetical protein
VLAARAIADTAILTLASAVTVAIAFAVGFRLHGSVVDGFAAFGLVVVFGFAFEWVFVALGLLAGNGQAAQGMGMIVFPFTFISSAYVPVDSLPGWLQLFAENQPITVMVDAVRALTLGPHSTVKLLVPDGATIDHDDLRRVGRGRVKDWTGTEQPGGRRIRLVGELRNGEVRVHRGGVAILQLLVRHRAEVRRAHEAGRL